METKSGPVVIIHWGGVNPHELRAIRAERKRAEARLNKNLAEFSCGREEAKEPRGFWARLLVVIRDAF